MKRPGLGIFVVALTLSWCSWQDTASAAVAWTQISQYTSEMPGNPNREYRRASFSGSNKLLHAEQCRDEDCQTNDTGSVYETNLTTGARVRIIDDKGCTHASASGDGTVQAYSCVNLLNDLAGEAATSTQVYVKVGNNPLIRLTAYDTGMENLLPNVSWDGNVVSWVSIQSTAPATGNRRCYFYNLSTSTEPEPLTSGANHTEWCIPNSDGSGFLVTSREVLDPTTDIQYQGDPNIYYFDGSSWEFKVAVPSVATFAEPRFSGNDSRFCFAASSNHIVGGSDGRRSGWVHGMESVGLPRPLFSTDEITGNVVIANFVASDETGENIVVASFADLDGGSATGENFYTGIFSQNDLLAQTACPVDIVMTDPLGRTCSKTSCDSPGCKYSEYDMDGDGRPNDRIWCPTRIAGEYQFVIVPDETAQPTDLYTLTLVIDGQPLVLADHVEIQDTNVPSEPYTQEVPAPVFPISLKMAALRLQARTYRLQGEIDAPAITGNVALTLSGGSAQPMVEDLSNITTYYQNKAGTLMRAKVQSGPATFNVRFKKQQKTGKWKVTITGAGLNLNQFNGSTDLLIGNLLELAGTEFRANHVFTRRRNGDLSFKQ